jgi:hypothetical protein
VNLYAAKTPAFRRSCFEPLDSSEERPFAFPHYILLMDFIEDFFATYRQPSRFSGRSISDD